MFACRKLKIRDILYAIAEFEDEEDARSAHSLARRIGVSYKTAWVLAHKLRQMMASANAGTEITADVAVDGANFSGKLRNKNIKKKRNDHRLRKFRDSTRRRWVVVIKERASTRAIIARAFESEAESVSWIKDNVPKSVTIFSDEANHWTVIGATHEHVTINHKEAYKIGDADTNTAESFFSTFRICSRVYRSISRGYFESYIQEQVWRRSASKYASEIERFFSIGKALGGLKSEFRGYWQRSLAT